MFDLTVYCALCGGSLANDLEDLPGFVWSEGQRDVLLEEPCTCESRALKGKCGTCNYCMIEYHGCACTDGCFNCNPESYARLSCPKENFTHEPSSRP